jgi:hypothetical protein
MCKEIKEIFVDGISHINFVNGMVRLTMGTLVPNDDTNATPDFRDEYRIIMPLNSFLAGFTSQKQLMEQFEANGLVTPKEENPVIPDVVN